MAGVRVRVAVDDADVLARLRGLSKFALTSRDWDRVGQELVASTVGRFERGRGPDDQPWTPSRRAARDGGQTLVDTARLRGSIAHRASADGVEVGTNVVYGAIHQFGSRDGGGRPSGIPPRPYLGLDDADRDAVRDVVLDALRAA